MSTGCLTRTWTRAASAGLLLLAASAFAPLAGAAPSDPHVASIPGMVVVGDP